MRDIAPVFRKMERIFPIFPNDPSICEASWITNEFPVSHQSKGPTLMRAIIFLENAENVRHRRPNSSVSLLRGNYQRPWRRFIKPFICQWRAARILIFFGRQLTRKSVESWRRLEFLAARAWLGNALKVCCFGAQRDELRPTEIDFSQVIARAIRACWWTWLPC